MSDPADEPAPQPPTDAPERPGRVAPSLVLVNTGHGKGKSTAAFGTALRAVALEWPVAVVQFLKSGDWNVGEETILRSLGVGWYAAGDGFTWDSTDLDETEAKARGAWDKASDLLGAGEHRLLIFDEISYAMTWGWIDTAAVVAAVTDRPERTSVILTGRDMPAPIVEIADTVTEMTKIKHAYDAGALAKRGLDY